MDEKIIMKGELKSAKGGCVALPLLGLIAFILYNALVTMSDYQHDLTKYPKHASISNSLAYAFSLSNGANLVFIPLIVVLAIVGFMIYRRWAKVQITVTTKRVYGVDTLSKRVDLPLDSITAVGTSLFSGLSVTTASGAIKFVMLKNRDELHKAISKLLVERQEKPHTTTIKQEIPQSDADELRKYKELLDNGVITQKEFDAKKKQILGI